MFKEALVMTRLQWSVVPVHNMEGRIAEVNERATIGKIDIGDELTGRRGK